MTELLLSQQDLLAIVGAASTLDERLGNEFLTDDAQTNGEVVKARREAWCQAVAKGDWEQFRQRLAWDGLDEERVRRALGGVWLYEGVPKPSWVDTLNEVLNLAAAMPLPGDVAEDSTTGECRLLFLDPRRPFPFEEILAPFVIVARERCLARARAAYHLLENGAHVTLQRSLLQTLTSSAALALHLEFSIEHARSHSPLERLLAQVQNKDDRTDYWQFVARMYQGGLATFFREYTVLARLLATITDLWVETTVEFLQRLFSDWPQIEQVFGGASGLGSVTSVQPSLSDPHRGRRSVSALTFASGRKVVYKPKDLGIEAAYYRLLAWLNEQGMPLPFKILTVLNCSGYGWVEFAEHEPCQNQTQVQRYYQRAGMLLCLVYVLGGTDCHAENLIACGEHPMLVDTETLMHPHLRYEDQAEGMLAQLLAHEQLTRSVLGTGLLPRWQVRDDEGDVYDVSGLAGGGEQELMVQRPKWEHINTDRMTLEYEPVKIRGQANELRLDGMLLRPQEHTEDVVEGFQQMYCFLLDHRETLLAAESLLHEFVHQQVRFVYQPTRIYSLLAQKLLNPMYLRDGADRSIQLEWLGRTVVPLEGPLRDKRERPRWWSIFAAERQAMTQTDIPFFTAYANSNTLIISSDQQITASFQEPSFELVLARLKALGDEDLEQQVAFIRASLYTSVTPTVAHVSAAQSTDVGLCLNTPGPSPLKGLVAPALAIAEQIARQAIQAADGSAAWIAPQYLTQAKRFQLQPMNYDLYGGTCGVALFLAAVEKVTGGAGYRDLALSTVQPLRQALQHYGQYTARDIGISGASGLGSVVYVLTRLSQWLDEPTLLADARRAASLITPERIADDRALDIITGAAGASLGLLALYNISSDQTILDLAIACGQHLLQSRTEGKTGYQAWPTFDGRCLTGFSHGAAGIAYALLRLYAATRDRNLLAAAQEGIAYEDDIFSPEASNWPDLRVEDQSEFSTSWCHGAPGIGLARIGGLPVLDTPQIRGDIEIALQTTLRVGLQGPDYLCCGNLGRAEVLLVAADRLSRPALCEASKERASQVVTRAEDTGSFRLHPLLPKQVYSPGFFQGTAGIGYALLRIAHTEMLPSVLLWE